MTKEIFFNLLRNRKWHSAFSKLRRTIMLFILVPVLLFNTLITINYSNKLNAETEEKTELECGNIYAEVESWFEEVHRVYEEFEKNETIFEFCTTNFYDFKGKEGAANGWKLKLFITDVGLNNDCISDISLLSMENKYVISTVRSGYLEEVNPQWYTLYKESKKTRLNYRNGDTIMVVRTLNDGDYDNGLIPMGVLVMELKKTMLDQELRLNNYTSDLGVRIYNVDGEELYTAGAVGSGKTMKYDIRDGTIKLEITANSNIKWQMIGTIAIYSLAYLAVGIVLAYILALLCSTYIYSSITEIISKMDSLNEGEASNIGNNVLSGLNKDSNIENELAEALNHLHNAQLTALQMQINPHFIFNVLNYANAVIFRITKCDNNASDIIVLLSNILRYAMSEPKYSASVFEEIAACKKYIEIEQMKVLEPFDVEWVIEEAVLGRRCIKLFLQPIVENAIMHGIKSAENGSGKIKITAGCDGEDMIFTVSDNGGGINAQKLEKICKQLQEPYLNYSKHVGLRNVNERIRLTYGDEYGVSITSDETGTTVTIRLGAQSGNSGATSPDIEQ